MPRILVLLLCCLALVGSWPGRAGAEPLRPLSIQLKWMHQFQFAGYYAALEQGYFAEAGLDVTLKEGRPDLDPVANVLAGDADFGIGSAELILARAEGRLVVAVAAIFQHSPFVIVANPAVHSVHDLAGKRIMVEPHAAELVAYLASEGVPMATLNVLAHHGDPMALRDGTVDAMTAYATTEPYLLDKAGIAYGVFDPKASGIDFYGDTLFTRDDLARRDPDLVRAVRHAVVKGWTYALAHPDAMIELIRQRYSARLSPEQLAFEARMIRKLAIPEVVDIGYMNPGRWRAIGETFVKYGLTSHRVDLDTFLFDYAEPLELTPFYYGLAAAIVVALLSVFVTGRFQRLNRALRREIARRAQLEDELRYQAGTDVLTGLPNRRHFLEAGAKELAKAQRHTTALTALMIDIDHFKAVNDSHGHQIGDHVIRMVGEICRSVLRDGDSVGRLGGEEFAVLLPYADAQQGAAIAERIRTTLMDSIFGLEEGGEFAVTCSIGIAMAPFRGNLDDFLKQADNALYEAKRAGRNCVRLAKGPVVVS